MRGPARTHPRQLHISTRQFTFQTARAHPDARHRPCCFVGPGRPSSFPCGRKARGCGAPTRRDVEVCAASSCEDAGASRRAARFFSAPGHASGGLVKLTTVSRLPAAGHSAGEWSPGAARAPCTRDAGLAGTASGTVPTPIFSVA